MMRSKWRVLSLAAGVLLLVQGCKSRPLGPYVSPRVEGLVVASDTGEPLARVSVSRGRDESDPSKPMAKGGELLIRKAPALTGDDGRFFLSSERVLSVIRGAGWSEVRLTFSKPGYFKLKRTYSLASATNSMDGEPLLDISKVELIPVR